MGVAVRIVRHNWRESAIYIPTNNKFRSHVCIGQWHTDHRFGFKGGEKTTEGRLEGVSPEKPYGRAGSTTHLITRHTITRHTVGHLPRRGHRPTSIVNAYTQFGNALIRSGHLIGSSGGREVVIDHVWLRCYRSPDLRNATFSVTVRYQ